MLMMNKNTGDLAHVITFKVVDTFPTREIKVGKQSTYLFGFPITLDVWGNTTVDYAQDGSSAFRKTYWATLEDGDRRRIKLGPILEDEDFITLMLPREAPFFMNIRRTSMADWDYPDPTKYIHKTNWLRTTIKELDILSRF